MCDETTAESHDRALAAKGLTRREFAALEDLLRAILEHQAPADAAAEAAR